MSPLHPQLIFWTQKSSLLLWKLLNLLPPHSLLLLIYFFNKLHQIGLKTWRVIDKTLTTTCSYLLEWKATVNAVFITVSFQGCTQTQLIFE